MMLNAPERVDRVILANTASKFGSPDTWNQRMAVVREGGLEALIDGVVDRWLTKDFQAAAPEAVARVRAMVLATPADGYIASMGGLRDIDLREPVRAAKSPVLVIVGDQDQGTTPEQGAEIVAAIPGARLVTLKAAHLSNIEDAAAFNAAVLDFLTSPLAALKPAATVYPRRRPAKKATKKPLRPAPAATLAPAKKATKKAAVKKAAAKKAAKKAVKKAAKKAAKKAVKKAPKKGVKKATKKPVKKAASKATKKAVVKKASAKKATPRKAAVKTASKSAKKPVKKAVKTAKGTGARKAKPKKAR
jgi:3-oxoadipate enol-lactonase